MKIDRHNREARTKSRMRARGDRECSRVRNATVLCVLRLVPLRPTIQMNTDGNWTATIVVEEEDGEEPGCIKSKANWLLFMSGNTPVTGASDHDHRLNACQSVAN